MTGQQKEIECELFQMYNQNLDRFFSLIKFIFLILGIYALTLSNIYGKFNLQAFDNAETISIYSILACSLFIGLALTVPFSQLLLPKECRFKQTESSIQLREEDELKVYNRKLFLAVQQQENYYVISFLLVLLSLTFFCAYFEPFAICISIPVFTITGLYYLTFSEWVKKENRDIKVVQPHRG
jgi:hypothetical protein